MIIKLIYHTGQRRKIVIDASSISITRQMRQAILPLFGFMEEDLEQVIKSSLKT